MSDSSISIAFVDVGQGDSTFITLPDKRTGILVDCPSKSATIDYIRSKNITSLDHVFISHTDEDHLGGMANLVANFINLGNAVGTLAYNHDTPKVRCGRRLLILRRLLDLSRKHGIKIKMPLAGMEISVQGLDINVIHPTPEDLYDCQLSDDINNASVVLMLHFKGQKTLLSGDIGGRGWKWIIDRSSDIRAHILKFPHHGAWYTPNSSEPSLSGVITRIGPTYVILSVGANNTYDHPDPRTIDLLCSISQISFAHTQPTARCYSMVNSKRGPFSCSGTVVFTVDGNGITRGG